MILCVYALVSPPPARLQTVGIKGERLKVITIDRLGVVVGQLRRVPAPSVTNLRRYAAVVESLAARTPAILPARFGTTVEDADELTMVIRSRARLLRQRLKAVRARAQMTIRLVESESRDAASSSQRRVMSRRLPTGNVATRGTRYLQQKMAAVAAEREVPAFAPVRSAIRRYVKDERVDRRADVVSINHLVPRVAVDRYRSALERAARENGIRLVVTGPWPPYAFADPW